VPFCSRAIRANWNRLITQRSAIRRFRGLSSSLSCYMQRARTDRVSPAINETRGGASLSLIARSRVSRRHTNSAARSCGEIPWRGSGVSRGIPRERSEGEGSVSLPTLKNYNNDTPQRISLGVSSPRASYVIVKNYSATRAIHAKRQNAPCHRKGERERLCTKLFST